MRSFNVPILEERDEKGRMGHLKLDWAWISSFDSGMNECLLSLGCHMRISHLPFLVCKKLVV